MALGFNFLRVITVSLPFMVIYKIKQAQAKPPKEEGEEGGH